MKYLIVDASLHGTGIRDTYNGGYICPSVLNLNQNLIQNILEWLKKYEEAYYNGYSNNFYINNLDKEGVEIARRIQEELKDAKVEYFSDAMMKKITV